MGAGRIRPRSLRRYLPDGRRAQEGRYLPTVPLGPMREEAAHPNEDPYRYRVEWGVAPTSAGNVTNWTELSWNEISLRTAPGPMTQYTVKFVAPSDKVVLALRAWKKWGTVQRELNVNLDTIRIVPCVRAAADGSRQVYRCGQAGDTLSMIAKQNGTTMAVFARMNGINNPNEIYVGQKIKVPCADPQPSVVVVPPVDPPVVIVDPAKPPVVIVDPAKPPGVVVDPAKPVFVVPPQPAPDDQCVWVVVKGGRYARQVSDVSPDDPGPLCVQRATASVGEETGRRRAAGRSGRRGCPGSGRIARRHLRRGVGPGTDRGSH